MFKYQRFKSHFPILILAVILSTSAIAAPKVGDRAVSDVVETINGRVIGQWEEVEEWASFDSVNRTFKLRTTKIQAGSSIVIDEENVPQQKAEDIASRIDALVRNCARNDGTPGTMTVQRRTITTCEIRSGAGTEWYGLVPFGVVKSENFFADRRAKVYTLKSFSFGR